MSTDTIENVLNGDIITYCFIITSDTSKFNPRSKASACKTFISLTCKRCSETHEYQIRTIKPTGKVKCTCHTSHVTLAGLLMSSSYEKKEETVKPQPLPITQPLAPKAFNISDGIPFKFQMIENRLSRKCCDHILYSPKIIHHIAHTTCQFCPNYIEPTRRIIISKFHKDLTKQIMTQKQRVDKYQGLVNKLKIGLALEYFDEDEDVYKEMEKLESQFDMDETYDFKMADKLEQVLIRYIKTPKHFINEFIKENNAQEFLAEMMDTTKKLLRAQRHLRTLKKCYTIKSKKPSDKLIKDIMNNIDTFCPETYNDGELNFTAFNKDITKLSDDNLFKCVCCSNSFHLHEKAIKLTLNSSKSCPFCFPIPNSDPHEYLEGTETPTFNYNFIRTGNYKLK